MTRTYLDWNATAPLRPEARAAMIAAMDVVGNPSSVHAEGRAAKGIIEKARGQVAALVGCEPSEVVLNSGATETIATIAEDVDHWIASPIEHDSVWVNVQDYELDESQKLLGVSKDGKITFSGASTSHLYRGGSTLFAYQRANSETGVLQDENIPEDAIKMGLKSAQFFRDVAQAVGKVSNIGRFLSSDGTIYPSFMSVSAHKFGGPKGSGALISGPGYSPGPNNILIRGGGQEMGRRSGTENVIGIAGFGAAAEAAQRDLDAGVWDEVRENRDAFEAMIQDAAHDVIIFGKEVPRLPNTSNFAIPGWKGETQVMQMDLAGFAVSAGSACSSGKVKTSRVLKAMGYDDNTASSAIRVSIGPTTTEAELMAFADTWIEHYRRFKAKAA